MAENRLMVTMNEKSSAVSQLSGLNFGSMASIGGKLYGANEDGLYVDSTSPNSYLYFITGKLLLGSDRNKRIRTISLSGTLSGDITVTIFDEDGRSYSKTRTITSGEREHHFSMGRAVKGTRIQVAVTVANAVSETKIDSITANVLTLSGNHRAA